MEDRSIVLLPSRTVTHRDDVADGAREELPTPADGAGPRHVVDRASWDAVDQASVDSFPASDAPPWTLGYPVPPAAGQADGDIEELDPP